MPALALLHCSILILTPPAAQQLAEADPAGWALTAVCLACRLGVEWGKRARFRRAA
ncbi:MAG: hypothetical protein MUO58_21255 [Anaerolineales bacterium]|nr:hypothetical protein [Anaerolineales bacterium]